MPAMIDHASPGPEKDRWAGGGGGGGGGLRHLFFRHGVRVSIVPLKKVFGSGQKGRGKLPLKIPTHPSPFFGGGGGDPAHPPLAYASAHKNLNYNY